MKSFGAVFLAAALALTADGAADARRVTARDFRTTAHPRVYFTTNDLPRLRKKAERHAWAAKFVRDTHALVDRHVARHADDPSFVVSRLQMHWEEGRRYTRFYTDGNYIPRREGNAKYPTIRPPYARSWGDGAKTGDWENEAPYGDGTLHTPDGESIPFEKTGQAYENMNDHFLRLAYHAAILYQLEGDARYAKFAADIVWTLVRGGAQQEEVNPGATDNCGFLSWETLGDTRHYWAIPLVWDMLYDYFRDTYFTSDEFTNGIPGALWAPGHREGRAWALEQFHIFFEKMIDNKLTRGGGLIGNWNLNEQQSAMLYALALDDDAAYADGRGRAYYVQRLVYGPTTARHGAYADVLRANIDEATGLWPEAPGGYGQGSIAQLVKFGFIYWRNGLDLLRRDPLLQKASRAMPQMTFPGGYITNVGDSSYHKIWSEPLELMLAYARAKKDKASFIQTASVLHALGAREPRGDLAFFFYLGEVPEVPAPPVSRVSYAPCYPTVIERNGTNVTDALAFALSGYSTQMGHRHPNGLNLEFCGRGEVLAPDSGAGADYWCRETHQYYRHVAGHNTVAPNGRGADDNLAMTFDRLVGEPAVAAGATVTNTVSPHRQFVQVESHFRGHDGFDCRQQRTVGIVRTGRASGYYVDVFRSGVLRGEEKYHDYIFHLMGTWGGERGELRVENGELRVESEGKRGMLRVENGEWRVGEGRERLDPESGKGYDYFKTVGAWPGGGWHGVVDYDKGVKTAVHLATVAGDTVYALEGPKAFRHYNRAVSERPCPAFIVRRPGEAWTRPFVAVYEPFGNGTDAVVADVAAAPVKGAPHVTAVTVTFKDRPGRRDVILAADGEKAAFTYGGRRFRTTFAVLSYADDRLVDIYAGDGTAKSRGGGEI